MLDRLDTNIQILKCHNEKHIPVLRITDGRKHEIEVIDEIYEDVSLILEKIKNKTLIELPCKVGDKIYMLVTRKTKSFVFEKGKRMLRVDNQHTFIKDTYLTKLNFFKVLDEFGKTVFLTREEAEKALKERGN